ncbi:UDP-Glycosyltransferase superfamily protein [Artemisia annua]|uniref:UDP-Glycosyltransferase superfamily protein n=1 Tax=Artemisia annua TaxID=35608 RepID=A0A2U1MAQ1_ARTAN|nr:UDP-Glycosyltransferase superfamily protein [Artemisia annua]
MGNEKKRKWGAHPYLDDVFEERVKEKDNVVQEWVNQREILEHEIVKGLSSHSGWNSVFESICAVVPSHVAFVGRATVE